MTKYSVVVGNIGTVHTGDDEELARDFYTEYVAQSAGKKGRCQGEAVMLFCDGEPIEEHLGYQHLYENMIDDELQDAMSRRRAREPGKCPNCGGECETSTRWAEVVLYDDGRDVRYRLKTRCTACGFKWKDVLRIVGVNLENK